MYRVLNNVLDSSIGFGSTFVRMPSDEGKSPGVTAGVCASVWLMFEKEEAMDWDGRLGAMEVVEVLRGCAFRSGAYMSTKMRVDSGSMYSGRWDKMDCDASE